MTFLPDSDPNAGVEIFFLYSVALFSNILFSALLNVWVQYQQVGGGGFNKGVIVCK